MEKNIFVEVEVENRYYEASTKLKTEEEEKALIRKKNEESQYGFEDVFSYKLNIDFVCADVRRN